MLRGDGGAGRARGHVARLCRGRLAPTPVDWRRRSATPIAHWEIQTSAKAQQSGAEVSSAGFSTDGLVSR